MPGMNFDGTVMKKASEVYSLFPEAGTVPGGLDTLGSSAETLYKKVTGGNGALKVELPRKQGGLMYLLVAAEKKVPNEPGEMNVTYTETKAHVNP
jgi:hypothetical protein